MAAAAADVLAITLWSNAAWRRNRGALGGHFRDCLKYRRSGGGWSLRVGKRVPSAPLK
jgi:hypothetical protein